MKNVKRLFSLLIAVAMVLTMSIVSTAADPVKGTITIQGTQENNIAGKTFAAYKLFDLTMSGEGADAKYAYSLKADSPFMGLFQQLLNKDAVTSTEAVAYVNALQDDAAIKAFAAAAYQYAVANRIAAATTIEAKENTASMADLELGYYLVYANGANASAVALNTTNPTATINAKFEYPTVDKVVDKPSASIGDTVTYTLTSKVPDLTGFSAYTFIFQDKMSKGLTFGEVTSAKIGENPVDVTAKPTTNPDGTTSLEIPVDLMKANAVAGTPIVVQYTAMVNENAVYKNGNEATVKYSNDPTDTSKTTTTPPDEVEVKTYTVDIYPVDGQKWDEDPSVKTPVQGGEYELKDPENNPVPVIKNPDGSYRPAKPGEQGSVTTLVPDDNGKITVKGIEEGTYTIVETKTPDGYNPVPSTSVSVNDEQADDNGVVEVVIPYYSGALLPGTGGMGTTGFVMIGAGLMIGAAVVMITKKKMAKN